MAAGEDGKPIEQARWVDQEGNYNHLAHPSRDVSRSALGKGLGGC